MEELKIRELLAALEGEDPSARCNAAIALSEAGYSEAEDAIIAACRLEPDNYRTTFLLQSLGRIGGPKSAAVILEFFLRGDRVLYFIHVAAKDSLAAGAGKHVLPQLIETLQHADLALRGDAADILGKLGDEAAVAGLARLIEELQGDKYSHIHRRAAHALASIGGEAAIRALEGYQESVEFRQHCLDLARGRIEESSSDSG